MRPSSPCFAIHLVDPLVLCAQQPRLEATLLASVEAHRVVQCVGCGEWLLEGDGGAQLGVAPHGFVKVPRILGRTYNGTQ